MTGQRRRSWYGWGWEDEALSRADVDNLGKVVAARFGTVPVYTAPPTLDEVDLPTPRLSPPPSLAHLIDQGTRARAAHTYGKAYRDVARAFERRWEHPPDAVALPADETDVRRVLAWAADDGAAVVPYGGGSSVVGGVEPDLTGTRDPDRPVISLDLARLAGLVEVDGVSRAALIRAGTYGPDADAALRGHGLTMRHFPQSYEHSTVGGWVATRSGGHFATGASHIDERVAAVRMVGPTGVLATRRLPASGAGPSPDRLLLGSEGTLGVITEAWLRVQERPRWRSSAAVHFADLAGAVTAARVIAQSGLEPANCRLLDPAEAEAAGIQDGTCALLLGFESADHPVSEAMARAVEIARDAGGSLRGEVRHRGPGDDRRNTSDAVGGWRSVFLRAPYLRDALIALGCLAETFETACTWADFDRLHAAVTKAVQEVLDDVCGDGRVGMRFTHVYPDGPAPYYTIIAPGRHGSLVAQWDEVKAAASEAILAAGGTITHHHAVGRVHRPWYDRQRPDVFAVALRAVKAELDPDGLLNPGVLV